MKPHKLPAEALTELERLRALEGQAQTALAGFRRQLAEIRAAAAAEHTRLDEKRTTLDALIARKGQAVQFIADAWTDYEDAVTRAVADQLRIKSRSAP